MHYNSIHIYEDAILGSGSFGKVCKAKHGQLQCAAKILHDAEDYDAFKQELQFLEVLKHPNLIQYLAMSVLYLKTSDKLGLVLLMELMDENLTRYLKRSINALPYHTQFNISHDVALALAYLHSNDIIHGDLTSNNVLLIGEGSRAKVTDFGLFKLASISQMTPAITSYMPPEALSTTPQYSNKLDCFSLGVLTIQIATRLPPNPSIDMVAPDHPLLPLALQCLKDNHTERPSADELCDKLATLKQEPNYKEMKAKFTEELEQILLSKESELERARASHKEEITKLQQEFAQREDELIAAQQEKENELERARENHRVELIQSHLSLHKLREMNEELKHGSTKLSSKTLSTKKYWSNPEDVLQEVFSEVERTNQEIEVTELRKKCDRYEEEIVKLRLKIEEKEGGLRKAD